jgi:hypothetical protein
MDAADMAREMAQFEIGLAICIAIVVAVCDLFAMLPDMSDRL